MTKIIELLQGGIDSTMIGCFRACPQKFYNEYVLGLRLFDTSIHLHAGACFAIARQVFNTEFHLNGKNLSRAKRKAFSAFSLTWGDVIPPDVPASAKPKTMGAIWLAFEDFLTTYPPITDHVQPYFVNGIPTFEHRFAIPLLPEHGFPLHPVTGEPFLYTGRFDMLGTWHGKPCVEDDKTGSSAGASWADQWTLRSQFIGYCWACQQEGIPVNTVVIRGVIIQTNDIRQLEAVKFYPDHVIERWLDRLRLDLHFLVSCWNQRNFPYDFADACVKFGTCAFMDLCYAKPENQPSLRTAYRVHRWDPTAADPTAPQPEVLL